MLLGGVCAKSAFSKKKFFLREDFLRPILTCTNTPTGFFDFSPHCFLNFFFQKNNLHILEELRQLFDENPWRNKSSKLNIFGPLFPKTHSALALNAITFIHLSRCGLKSIFQIVGSCDSIMFDSETGE